MLNIENISKSHGDHVLFVDAGFKVNSRERVGLVGRNGHGKTTLLKMIVGEEPPDNGRISIPRNYRIGYVKQRVEFKKPTILDEGMRGLPANEKDHYWKVEKILFGLGFSRNDLSRNPMEFSGGLQVRLNLAKVLVSEPDLLLLDEPTNYLDITSIRWVEQFLNNWSHELLLITHDRNFMDKVVTHTIGIHRHKVRKIKGNTTKYYAQLTQDEEIYENTRINDEKRRREVELFVTRFRAKARLANMVQSRIKTLAKMEKRNKLEKLESLTFSFKYLPFSAKNVLNIEGLTFGYQPKQPLIKGFNIHVQAGERICIVGKNGRGKTTLLKLLSGVLSPLEGRITEHLAVVKGFFEQTNIQSLVDTRTVEEEIQYAHTTVDRQQARDICGSMMFSGEAALKKIGILSGGEKSRVMLGKILATPVNMLLLDEPTNHLDMDACDALLAAVDRFNGTVIMVTHNEMFLHALAERLVIFRGGGIDVFEGGYQRFLDQGGWGDGSEPVKPISEETDIDQPAEKLTKKEIRQRRSGIIAHRSKNLKPLERKIKHLEDAIGGYEEDLSAFNKKMVDASKVQDSAEITRFSQSIHRCRVTIDTMYDKLDKLTTALEKEKSAYKKELAIIEDRSI